MLVGMAGLTLWLTMVAASAAAAQTPARRAIAYDDLAPAVRSWIQRTDPDAGRDASTFDAYVRSLQQRNRERRVQGDGEHLVYFALQSTAFTEAAPIEPALSAKAFFANLDPRERRTLLQDGTESPPARRIPPDARRRLEMLAERRPDVTFAQLAADYTRAMRFLYQKEFPHDAEAPAMASLYQERGFSTDTAFEANFGLHLALGTLKALSQGERLNRALIVGPGLDQAPRTGFLDLGRAQSYQPFALADSLLALSLADRDALSIHAVDINDSVLAYLRDVRDRRVTELQVASAISVAANRTLSQEYEQYFRGFGRHIGVPDTGPRPAGFEHRLFKAVLIDEPTARRMTTDRLDIVTERYQQTGFDLVVVTNVLTYFGDVELAMALSNMASMLRPGGYVIHNETRQALPALADAAGLTTIHSRSALVATSLYDTAWIHRKGPAEAGHYD